MNDKNHHHTGDLRKHHAPAAEKVAVEVAGKAVVMIVKLLLGFRTMLHEILIGNETTGSRNESPLHQVGVKLYQS
jgi:hypothetical protein